MWGTSSRLLSAPIAAACALVRPSQPARSLQTPALKHLGKDGLLLSPGGLCQSLLCFPGEQRLLYFPLHLEDWADASFHLTLSAVP